MWCSTPWSAERRQALLASVAIGLGTDALAQPTAAEAPAAPRPDAHPQLPGSRLQGQATLRYFGLRVYHARLWTLPHARPEAWSAQPLVLELEYLLALKGAAVAEPSLQEMRRAAHIPDTQAQPWMQAMLRIFPDLKAGDRLTGLFHPGEGASFWHNTRPAGQVGDADFARLFFGIWLAPTTSAPELRQALLGPLSPPTP